MMVRVEKTERVQRAQDALAHALRQLAEGDDSLIHSGLYRLEAHRIQGALTAPWPDTYLSEIRQAIRPYTHLCVALGDLLDELESASQQGRAEHAAAERRAEIRSETTRLQDGRKALLEVLHN